MPAIDPEALRAKLMNDADTKGIAEKLQVDLAEYVNQVVFYAMNPKAEPVLYVAKDEDIAAMGLPPPPDPDAVGKFILETVAIAKAQHATEYNEPKKRLVTLENALPQADLPADEELKHELDKGLRGKRSGKS